MAGWFSWVGNAAHRVAHDINNDVVNPVKRDVINPVAHAAGNVVHAVAPSTVENRVVRPVVNQVQGGVAQVNPFDSVRTYSTVMNRGAQFAPRPQQSLFQQATHNGLTNVVGGAVKFVPQFSADYANTFANLGRRATGVPDATIQQNLNDPFSRNLVKISGATGTNRQLAGDALQVGLSTLPGGAKLGENAIRSVLPAVPKVAAKLAASTATVAPVGAAFNEANLIGSDAPLTRKNVEAAGSAGFKAGGELGAIAALAPELAMGGMKLAKNPAEAVQTVQKTVNPMGAQINEHIAMLEKSKQGKSLTAQKQIDGAIKVAIEERARINQKGSVGGEGLQLPKPSGDSNRPSPVLAGEPANLGKASASKPTIPATPEQVGKALGMKPADVASAVKETNPKAPIIIPHDRSVANVADTSATKIKNQRLRGTPPPEENNLVSDKLSHLPPPSTRLPKVAQEAGDLKPVQKLPDREKLLASKLTVLKHTNTNAGRELGKRMLASDRGSVDLRAKWMHQIPTVQKLNRKEAGQLFDVVEKKIPFTSVSPKVQQAAKEWRKLTPEIHRAGWKQGLVVGERQNYVPHNFHDAKEPGTMSDAEFQHALDTGQIKHNVITNTTRNKSDEYIGAKRFGNFENARLTKRQDYSKSKQELYDYIAKAADRVSKAKYLGIDGQIGHRLLDNVRLEGGDYDTAVEAYKNYVSSPRSDSTLAKGVQNVRGGLGFARLSKAAISHAGQTSNTAVDAGVARTTKAWGSFLANNKGNKDFVDRTGVINPQALHHYENQYTSVKGLLSKGTAPGLNTMLKINRSVTALAYRDYAKSLAEKGNIVELRKLGVTGDIGKTLTDQQQLEAARGGVERTMFGGSRATTPVRAETPLGKTIGQYRTAYAYPQTRFIYEQVVKAARNGDLKPLTRYLAVSGAIGVGTIAVKNKISGRKEGLGGMALDTLGALGGLPGEMLVNGARYGARDVTKEVASDIAPALGEAVDLGERATQALQGKPQQLERYGLGLIPGVGGRVSQAVVPYTKTITSGDAKVTLKNNQIDAYNKVHDQLGKPATQQLTSSAAYKNLSPAEQAKALNSLKSYITKAAERKYASDNGIGQYSAGYKGKDSAPTVREQQILSGKITPKDFIPISAGGTKVSSSDYTYKLPSGQSVNHKQVTTDYTANTARLSSAKTSGDLTGYISTAQKQLQNISTQLHDPNITPTKSQQLATKAQTLQSDIGRYSAYGSFTKPKGASTYHTIGTISGAKPDYVSAITKSAAKYGVDINAALAVAAQEGLGGGVGDNGTSFGPFQMHVGGALPKGKDQAWAESPAGIDYAMQQIAKVSAGKSGQAAIEAIVNSFERPADPSSEIANALAVYTGSGVKLTPGSSRTSILTGSSSSGGSSGKYDPVATAKLKFALAQSPLKIVGALPAPSKTSAPKFTTPALKTVYQKKTVQLKPKVSVSKPK